MGSFLIGGIYLNQVRQLDSPVIVTRPLVYEDPNTGDLVETNVQAVLKEDVQRAVAMQIEQDAYRIALNDLRRASFAALAVLFVSSFGTGWLLSGWALRPVERIAGVARDIGSTDLSRRISLRGPNDELKRLADTFDAMLDRIQNAFEDQQRFVHEASHELRNPLAIARTNLEVALDSGDPIEIATAAEIAHRATGRMSLLVEDLLEQAREGVPELNRAAVDLAEMAVLAAEEFAAPASERNLTIVTDTGDAPAIIRGDGPALRRALSNLLANAVRLAPMGSAISIGIKADPECVLVTVADEGPGIPPSDHLAIFERFFRGGDPGAGSGLGLSIVSRIVERHGGSVTVDSDIGKGSTFTLRLPVPMTRDKKFLGSEISGRQTELAQGESRQPEPQQPTEQSETQSQRELVSEVFE